MRWLSGNQCMLCLRKHPPLPRQFCCNLIKCCVVLNITLKLIIKIWLIFSSRLTVQCFLSRSVAGKNLNTELPSFYWNDVVSAWPDFHPSPLDFSLTDSRPILNAAVRLCKTCSKCIEVNRVGLTCLHTSAKCVRFKQALSFRHTETLRKKNNHTAWC